MYKFAASKQNTVLCCRMQNSRAGVYAFDGVFARLKVMCRL